VASVAADPSAIAPPLPVPNPSVAPAPAGPSTAFADLLDASAAPAAAQPLTSGARADAGTNVQTGGAAGGADPATVGNVTRGPRNGKNAGSKDTDDQTAPIDKGTIGGNATVAVTVVAGVPMLPFAIVPQPNPDQTPAASQDTQGASAKSAPPTGDDAASQSDDRKDASASSDALAGGAVAAVPSLVPIPAAASALDTSTPGPSRPIASLPPTGLVPGPNAAVNGVPAAAQSSSKAPAATQDMLSAVPVAASTTSPPDELQTAALPVLPPVAAGGGAPNPNTGSAPAASPIATPVAPSGPLTPAIALIPPSPPTPLTLMSAETHLGDQPAGSAEPAREAEPNLVALPAQVAARFALPVHADDGNTSDSGTDVKLGFASGGIGGATGASGNGQPGIAIPASFNPGLPNSMPAASAPLMAPQHAAITADSVPLAGIPVAIVAHAEAGERRFEIRLDPPDLGRIEVQLNVDSSGRATSHLVVDRADTLDLLRRDAPALERALQSAGLTTGDGALQFSLRDQSFAGRDQGAPVPVTPPTPAAVTEGDVAPIDTALRRYGLPAGLGGGVDIRV
jgi:flagellar hook-length control protein FliK